MYPPAGRFCCCGRSRANRANSHAPDALGAPRGMQRLSPPAKNARPAVGSGQQDDAGLGLHLRVGVEHGDGVVRREHPDRAGAEVRSPAGPVAGEVAPAAPASPPTASGRSRACRARRRCRRCRPAAPRPRRRQVGASAAQMCGWTTKPRMPGGVAGEGPAVDAVAEAADGAGRPRASRRSPGSSLGRVESGPLEQLGVVEQHRVVRDVRHAVVAAVADRQPQLAGVELVREVELLHQRGQVGEGVAVDEQHRVDVVDVDDVRHVPAADRGGELGDVLPVQDGGDLDGQPVLGRVEGVDDLAGRPRPGRRPAPHRTVPVAPSPKPAAVTSASGSGREPQRRAAAPPARRARPVPRTSPAVELHRVSSRSRAQARGSQTRMAPSSRLAQA